MPAQCVQVQFPGARWNCPVCCAPCLRGYVAVLAGMTFEVVAMSGTSRSDSQVIALSIVSISE